MAEHGCDGPKRAYHLYVTMGPMCAGKSAALISVHNQYECAGFKTYVIKPGIDTRDGAVVKSRLIHDTIPVDRVFSGNETLLDFLPSSGVDALFVDEAHFMTPSQVEELRAYADRVAPVFCYGLLSDFKRQIFPGSASLLVHCSTTPRFVKALCQGESCTRRAVYNMRTDARGVPVFDGPSVMPGDDYKSVCFGCYELAARKVD